ncbi:MAG: ion channel [Thermodesulfobacteriota bacterium]
MVLVALSFAATLIPEADARLWIVDVAYTVLLGFAVTSVRGRLRIATVLLALPALIGHWSLRADAPPVPRLLVFCFTAAFLAFLTLVMLWVVLREQVVTVDTLIGAVCAYFLIGVTFGTTYAIVGLTTPNAFDVSPALAAAADWHPPASPLSPLLQYYSFATLSTLGYGDMSPVSPAARSLSVLEGLAGPLYLAVLITRLVGMHTARSSRR